MTKNEHINYWISISKKDWQRAELLFKNTDSVFALFCAHLCLEKLCKARWVRDHKDNHPPRIHNLVSILEQTNFQFTEEEGKFINLLNRYQLEGRYPDYHQSIYRFTNFVFTKQMLQQAKEFKECLLKKLS